MTAELGDDSGLSTIEGWGRYPRTLAKEIDLEVFDRSPPVVRLARGLGRSYGDASLPCVSGGSVGSSRFADRFLRFDPASGELRVEAGCSLRRLNSTFLPQGWLVPVCPGTQDVTLGGMVAADVHGKNHHRDGTIGRWVDQVRLELADGRLLDCSRDVEPELFWATVGGMGLTGIVREVSVRLVQVPSPWIFQSTRATHGLDELCESVRRAGDEFPYTVGWLDLFTRDLDRVAGVRFAGRFADASEAPSGLPAPVSRRRLPLPRVRPWQVRLANRAYRWRNRSGSRFVSPESFFFPLDGIVGWNRTYGAAGFLQYQCVVPWGEDRGGARRVVEAFLELGGISYLTVVKDCGPAGDGVLTFPMRGVTITFDFPVQGERTESLVRSMNERVIEWGGRVYLAKDALTTEDQYHRMDDRVARFQAIRRHWDPSGRFRSSLSQRLFDGTEGDQ